VYKINDNDLAPKRSEPYYDPVYKYNYLYKVLVHNTNAITKYACTDQCCDETSFPFGGFGESGSSLIARIMGKPGLSKGGQIVLSADVGRNRVRAYTHRHKVYQHPPGFTCQGPAEARRIMEILCPLVIGEESSEKDFKRQIFKEKPHITFDNYFSGDGIMDWAGQNGFSATMTCRRDRLPKGIENKYLHKESTQNGDKRARVGRFNNPITLVKTVTMPPAVGDADSDTDSPIKRPVSYTRVHVSFQSTSSTNISTVNALNANKRMVLPRERGQGAYKRKWVIEYNEARQLYLSSYGRIDTIDAAVKKCHMGYRSWKYWHNAKTHGYALVQVTAYDMYKECMSEPAALEAFGITPENLKQHPLLTFHEFREKLSTQGLEYNALKNNYPGDSKMR
jgi:hypothetical protein